MPFHSPAFFSIKEFAATFFLSENHIRNGANQSFHPDRIRNRARLPEGYEAAWWNSVYIIYDVKDRDVVLSMFGIDPETRIGRFDKRPVIDSLARF